jgi:peptidoglycan lytic transglycosylase G
MKKSTLWTIVAVDALLMAGIAMVVFSLTASYQGYKQPVVVMIEPGTSSREIGTELESQGVIRSRWLFLAARSVRLRSKLMAGEYRFDQPMSVWEVFDHIASGKVLQHPFTVREGLTRFEIAALAETRGFTTREEFLAECQKTEGIRDLAPEAKSLEGFLFPETYLATRPFSAAQLVDMMVTRFRSVFEELSQGRAPKLTPYELVTLASMIEKETAVGGERKLVASVFYNRLDRRMLLQCDPTVIYGLVLEDRYEGRLTRDELAIPHLYNTYVHAGLPPGPIANPGRASLEAAFEPAKTNYLYFVAGADGGGGHVFSESLEAHNRAVGAYRRSR